MHSFYTCTCLARVHSWDEAAVDIILPGLGWIAVTGCGDCTVGISTPDPIIPLGREPLIASEGGGGVKATLKTQVKFTGTKLRNGRGHRKRG